ncbi:hypothetical protein CcaverHIS002_0101780 [Cutaneotrichosporon cavernicola]|uniref:Single hybrid motif-containing protein n=1 Tax=Cutaneotrichosporon cavernicola TaxID=279322 RepID=A0AA48L0E6_9TREE|nr:uncharacterized protein CcaverHIS019_0101750 [Cutaneotrichosporon cavernicola]BEI79649.1 hypothetical protein CcaverHIS002_0101780 [Cutaneotrichosporon cavernicola]BEI87457.1 hypothetical protein CcaverHIS019_0101750 [Cutaneotrichosporon cavernicola]BEI95227.1 hypothetical protein CcaverHIS631_0101760 [Cutaneotrichosporon cavernicola]BEJ03000.1 hypothetical protein CcaverHIS641_0101750 [Cutaneotrichosporon cavernicola]
MRAASTIARSLRARASAHRSALAMQTRAASSLLRMPAMSPTMTEGGIAAWKKNEGESFEAGDVILEVETDKATIDVEAQDDGVMGKIVFKAGSKNVPIGEVIAVLAEEGDDLSKLEVPSDLSPHQDAVPSVDAQEAPKEAPKEVKQAAPESSGVKAHRQIDHSKPMLPSVALLLQESSLSDEQVAEIKGTGLHGILTKGDILAAEGKIKSPYGSAAVLLNNPMGASGKRANDPKTPPKAAGSAAAPAPERPLTGTELRRLIVAGLSKATAPTTPAPKFPTAAVSDAEFDDLLSDYAKLLPASAPRPAAAAPKAAAKDELDGLA